MTTTPVPLKGSDTRATARLLDDDDIEAMIALAEKQKDDQEDHDVDDRSE